MIKRSCLFLTVIFILSSMILTADIIGADNREDVTVEVKEMVGEIVYFSPRNNPRVIAIENDAENTDYSFIIDKNTKIERKKSMKDIKVGDTIRVVYSHTIKIDNKRRKSEELLAKVISFVRAGKKREDLEPESETGVKKGALVSEEYK